MLIHAFITHKEAERFSECQDRFSINPDTKSIALSDGMSQSIFQKYWAEILVTTYTSDQEWFPNLEAVRKLSPQWREKVEEYIKKQKSEGKPTWRAERSLITGLSAGATFLGIRFIDKKWSCEVLGDSCLIFIQNNKIEKILSSKEVSVFNNYPDYYDSDPKKEGKGVLKTYNGKLESEDIILLVSDPFSDFLSKNEGTNNEEKLLNNLLSITTHNEFEKLVKEWRSMGMHNDDSTLIIIKDDKTPEFNVEYGDCLNTLINQEKNINNCHYSKVYNPILRNEEVLKNEEEKIRESSMNSFDCYTWEKQLNEFKIKLESYIGQDILKWKKALEKERNRTTLNIYTDKIISMVNDLIHKTFR